MEMLQNKPRRGFTLIELMMAIVIIGILAVLLFPAIGSIRSRVEKVRCVANLRSLYAASSLYVQQKGHWPQIDAKLIATDKKAHAKAWIAALEPMGVSANAWICPTIQHNANGPDFLQEDSIRIDYIPMPFDSKEMTPYRWPSQPWFIENSDVHGNGNLLIFTDGTVRELNDVKKSPPPSSR